MTMEVKASTKDGRIKNLIGRLQKALQSSPAVLEAEKNSISVKPWEQPVCIVDVEKEESIWTAKPL